MNDTSNIAGVDTKGGNILDLDRDIPIAGVDIKGLTDPRLELMPPSVKGALSNYVEHRVAPDDMLCAALAGELRKAEVLANTHKAGAALPLIWYWVSRYCPMNACGSIANVSCWLGGAK